MREGVVRTLIVLGALACVAFVIVVIVMWHHAQNAEKEACRARGGHVVKVNSVNAERSLDWFCQEKP